MNEYDQFVMASEYKGAIKIEKEAEKEPLMTKDEPKTTANVKEKFETENPFFSDIQALYREYGFMVNGLKIETTLQDLLKLCPRKREKTDAYNGLVKHLKERYGVELVITSRKKNNLKKEEL